MTSPAMKWRLQTVVACDSLRLSQPVFVDYVCCHSLTVHLARPAHSDDEPLPMRFLSPCNGAPRRRLFCLVSVSERQVGQVEVERSSSDGSRSTLMHTSLCTVRSKIAEGTARVCAQLEVGSQTQGLGADTLIATPVELPRFSDKNEGGRKEAIRLDGQDWGVSGGFTTRADL